MVMYARIAVVTCTERAIGFRLMHMYRCALRSQMQLSMALPKSQRNREREAKMEIENDIIELLKETLKYSIVETKVPRERRVFVWLEKEALKPALRLLKDEYNITFISTISGVDLENEIELLYHLVYEGSVSISLRVKVPKKDLVIPTITDILPGAMLYEREVHEMFGVFFEGHPNLSLLILPENWPDGVYPLRKKSSIDESQELTNDGR
ncbi:NADH-quinone oxidoreductase subunit C [Candidatus Thorarchaeota archaeon]|nr:MAG: NADH-quinone oxidoreductase subunit C [Candidatus Thorarchaeota archaeon]